MRNDTRVLYNGLLKQLAGLNNVPSVAEKFSVEASIQQKLETKIQESSAFLNSINMIGVDELKGEKLGLGINGPVARRTNTSGNGERQTRDLHTLDNRQYECRKTDFDTHIRYNTLDAWAKFKDFQTRVRDVIVKQQGLDRMMIGWNGTSAAEDTNPVTNPLLQDVNLGWLHQIRTDAPTRVIDHGTKEAGKIIIGPDGDYRNLDALVVDVTNELLDPWYQNAPGLVVILGRKLMNDKLFPLVNEVDDPTEIIAADIIRSQKRCGGLPAVTVPFFPEDTFLVTTLDNLSIYWQIEARRRHVMDNPKKNRIENFESSNDAYVVEQYGLCGMAENIEFQEA